MDFGHFQFLMKNVMAQTSGKEERQKEIPPERMHPLVLAYIGDACFTMFVRTALLNYEQNKVRVLHTYDAKIVSAKMQAVAYRELESSLTDAEIAIVKRGRNAKSNVPKSATVGEYRCSTGFEALLGFLFLTQNYDRLSEIAGQAFMIISREMTNIDKNSGGK
ncbi:MAG: ribonuclease III [Pelosinus sp.]|nr:ribonuclease III [Pelosinus sp.]